MIAQKNPDQISDMLASDAVLRDAILDAQDYDGTLVALVNPCVSRLGILRRLEKAWSGQIELHCATDLMVGGQHND